MNHEKHFKANPMVAHPQEVVFTNSSLLLWSEIFVILMNLLTPDVKIILRRWAKH